MSFQPTPLNVTSLLVVAVGVLALLVLSRKQFDSNLPLLFYLLVLAFGSWTDRTVNEMLYGAGLVLSLLLRFEFMNPSMTKLVLVLEVGALAGINVSYLSQIFNL